MHALALIALAGCLCPPPGPRLSAAAGDLGWGLVAPEGQVCADLSTWLATDWSAQPGAGGADDPGFALAGAFAGPARAATWQHGAETAGAARGPIGLSFASVPDDR